MVNAHNAALLSRGTRDDGQPMTQRDREELIKPFLPSPGAVASRHQAKQEGIRLLHRYSIQSLLDTLLHRLVFYLVQIVFTLYIRLRQIYHALSDRLLAVLYYHHRTPELIHKDIRKLTRLPKHLSVIVDLGDTTSSLSASTSNSSSKGAVEAEALSKLITDVAEISAWCACAGIPLLSVYEASGALKSHIPSLHRQTARTFRAYFPPAQFPTLQIRAPHHAVYSPPPSSPTTAASSGLDPHASSTTSSSSSSAETQALPHNLSLLLLSATDGRTTLVDLTKTLAEMAQRGKLSPRDVSAELIDAELSEACCGEPDLLVVMAKSRGASWGVGGGMRTAKSTGRKRGKRGDEGAGEREARFAGGDLWLRGYPPWQVRLTEIFHVPDNSMGVGYQVFLRALHRYASAEMRFGR